VPAAAPRSCASPGCPGLVSRDQGSHCANHQPPTAAPRSLGRPARDERGSASSRGYGVAWRRLRLTILAAEPLCRACAAQGRTRGATDVDHIVPLARGGTNARENLQPLCHECHGSKTATEDSTFAGWQRRRHPRGVSASGSGTGDHRGGASRARAQVSAYPHPREGA
jgi:5-methylcytosine-specific restriction protein A